MDDTQIQANKMVELYRADIVARHRVGEQILLAAKSPKISSRSDHGRYLRNHDQNSGAGSRTSASPVAGNETRRKFVRDGGAIVLMKTKMTALDGSFATMTTVVRLFRDNP
jgi:hypothetical protein